MRRFVRDNGLSLFFGAIFVAALVGQSFAGMAQFNQQQLAEGMSTVGYGQYVTSSDFAVDVAENWQSEYLQFLLYIWATVWLVQKGSTESKETGEAGKGSDKDQQVGRYTAADAPGLLRRGGLSAALYSRSLSLTMGTVFFGSWLAQSVAGTAAYDQQQLAQRQDPVSWLGYLVTSDFWNRTLQNWQSEFLAVGSMAILSVYLRQRGSPESKPVGASHEATGVTG
jgi:hypothetical protein